MLGALTFSSSSQAALLPLLVVLLLAEGSLASPSWDRGYYSKRPAKVGPNKSLILCEITV